VACQAFIKDRESVAFGADEKHKIFGSEQVISDDSSSLVTFESFINLSSLSTLWSLS
jgi:hypothetical protein